MLPSYRNHGLCGFYMRATLAFNGLSNLGYLTNLSVLLGLLFRFTALVIRFVKNLFRKIKDDNLILNSYFDAKEIYEAKVHWVKANQLHLLKSDNYEHLSKNFFI